jgi:hypothetical protein
MSKKIGHPKTEANPTTASTPPKLLDQVRGKLRAKHYSIRTEEKAPLSHLEPYTMIYTHVLNRGGRGVISPLDHL